MYQLLAERSQARSAASSASAAETPRNESASEREDAKDYVWTEDRLARVAQGDTITTQVLTDIMDVIALDPRSTHEYNQEDLSEETGHSAGRVKASFTKLTPPLPEALRDALVADYGKSGCQLPAAALRHVLLDDSDDHRSVEANPRPLKSPKRGTRAVLLLGCLCV